MKQLLQNLKNGSTKISNAPSPANKPGYLLIATLSSVISVGTEKMLVEFSRSGYLAKAKQQPEKVKQVIEKIKTDGLLSTAGAVQSKLNQLIPLGYCNAGVVIGVGDGVEGFSVGDRVASNGPHAEVVSVPKHLCVKVPQDVADEEAAFTVVGSIAMQGVRLAQPYIGESFIVYGVGIVGLLTVQILLANGCRVMAIDYNESRLKLAEQYGAKVFKLTGEESPLHFAESFTTGQGVDGVIITAATTSNKPVEQAAQMCRKRGRIILVGTTGLQLSRDDFYQKELTFQVSCSYGPGRDDLNYEDKGHDYPIGYVRWTEQRNMQAVVELISIGKLDVKSMITHRFLFGKAVSAYDMIMDGKEEYLGIVLQYPEMLKDGYPQKVNLRTNSQQETKHRTGEKNQAVIGLIGAGDFTRQVLMPVIIKSGAVCKTIASSGGANASVLGRQFGFQEAVSDNNYIFEDEEINTVFITTRHDSHAGLVLKALEAGKNVFVEKPLCINQTELESIEQAYRQTTKECAEKGNNPPILMVGFNRRFSPFVKQVIELTGKLKEPKSMVMTINAGFISADHWIQDMEVGGGRIIGEACHFIDLLKFIAGCSITDYKATALRQEALNHCDTVTITLAFEDGSIGSINYLANGHKAYPKEKLEIFCNGRILVLENFRKLKGYGWPGFRGLRSFKLDKGHQNEVKAFIEAVKEGKPSPIEFEDLVEATKISLLVDKVARGN